MKQFYFISGLPRSGTTVLSAILNQNPNFQASISGPLARFVRSIIHESSAQGGYKVQCPVEKRKQIITDVFNSYYNQNKIYFDTNRGWTLLLHELKDLFPYTKVICCVRDIPWILDSFENLIRKNKYSTTNMFSPEENISVYSRCEALMRSDRTVGFAYMALKQGITSAEKNMIMLVEYEQLAKYPKQTLKAIHTFINQPYYEYDFDNVESSYDEFDEDVQIRGLHTTRKKVEFVERHPIIPPDIWNAYSNLEVWR